MKTTLAVSAVALVVLAVVAAVLVVLWRNAEAGPAATATRPAVSSAAPLTVTGQVILKPTFDSITSGEGATCSGAGEYADIVQGAQVVVTDAAGTTVGVGQLEVGLLLEPGCTFPFKVPGVAGGGQFYGVQVAQRGRTQYTAEQLLSPLELRVGS